MKFQRIASDTEEVSIDQQAGESSDSQSVIDQLQIGGCPEQQAKLKALLDKYIGVFAVEDEDLGHADKVKHEIYLTDDPPVTVR